MGYVEFSTEIGKLCNVQANMFIRLALIVDYDDLDNSAMAYTLLRSVNDLS